MPDTYISRVYKSLQIPVFYESAVYTALVAVPMGFIGTSYMTKLYAHNSLYSVPKYITPSILVPALAMAAFSKDEHQLSGVGFAAGLSMAFVKYAIYKHESQFICYQNKPLNSVILAGMALMGLSLLYDKYCVDDLD